ncbi:hypothetical protein, partial [Paenibacillus sp. OSY-SE]|uniref:hypothetical protein n=1 Tax=Paenibacillus sp. OSY-SE TaxID=1196323 RepID=UPI0012FCEF93
MDKIFRLFFRFSRVWADGNQKQAKISMIYHSDPNINYSGLGEDGKAVERKQTSVGKQIWGKFARHIYDKYLWRHI